jgi:hypothetical protein
MNIFGVRVVKILNFKSARSLLSNLFVPAPRAILRPSCLELGTLAYDSEDRRIFSDLSQILTTIEHGFYVRTRRASIESSTAKWVMSIEVGLKVHSPMHSKVDGLSASQN